VHQTDHRYLGAITEQLVHEGQRDQWVVGWSGSGCSAVPSSTTPSRFKLT
jgi:hypothetical protein